MMTYEQKAKKISEVMNDAKEILEIINDAKGTLTIKEIQEEFIRRNFAEGKIKK